ncbi:hypothetical protein GQ473_05765, partial [archaeon]|nr:hypothetical protein [archaeon]
ISRMYSEFARAWENGTKYNEELAAELYVVEQIHKLGIDNPFFLSKI